jgi:hypothetical protein
MSEVKRLEAIVADLKLRNRLLRDRPDLSIERLDAYQAITDKLAESVAHCANLNSSLIQFLAFMARENNCIDDAFQQKRIQDAVHNYKKVLEQTPKQSLAEVQAKAIDRFRATITENLPISCQLEFIYESKNYTNQLREQAKEGVK